MMCDFLIYSFKLWLKCVCVAFEILFSLLSFFILINAEAHQPAVKAKHTQTELICPYLIFKSTTYHRDMASEDMKGPPAAGFYEELSRI